MNTNQVSVKQSNALIRKQMNYKVENNLQKLLKDYSKFLAQDIVGYEDLSQLSLNKAAQVVQGAVNRYLAQKDGENAKGKNMSSLLAQMGGSLFQNFRVYRDMLYTKQNRQQRLLSCLRGQLYKAMANADTERGAAYI